jgi:hypothetical protein
LRTGPGLTIGPPDEPARITQRPAFHLLDVTEAAQSGATFLAAATKCAVEAPIFWRVAGGRGGAGADAPMESAVFYWLRVSGFAGPGDHERSADDADRGVDAMIL